MKNKLKLLLLGIIGLLTISSSQTNALTFKGGKSSEEVISGYNNFSHVDYNNGFYGCILKSYIGRANLKRESAGCSDGYYDVYSSSRNYYALKINGIGISSAGGYKLYAKKESSDVFSFLKYKDGEEPAYRRITIKNLQSKMLNVASQRGENVYDEGFVDGIGFAALVKDENQVRAAHIIGNSYILDGYFLAIRQYESYIIDTYTNKIYKYKNNFYSTEMMKDGVAQIFPKLWNTIPDEISDVVRGLPTENSIYFNNQYITFDIANTQTGTKATLGELRENIKKSIIILDKEGAEFFLGQTPESLGIGQSKPNTDNQTNTNSTQPTNNGSEAKKACVDYYTKMKAFTAHSNGCRGEATTGEQFEYWENILFGSYEIYNTWDKARYWRCWQFGRYKESVVKQLGEKYSTFQQEWETLWIDDKAENVDVNALCSHISLTNQEKLQEAKDNQGFLDKLWRSIGFLGSSSGEPIAIDGSGNALYQGDFQNELRALQPYYWQCQGYDKYGLTKLSNQSETERKNACKLYEKYKNKLLEKWKGVELEYTNDPTVEGQVKMQEERLGKGNGMLESVGSGVSNTLSEGGEVLLKAVKDPFYSGYNAIIPLKCSSSPHLEFMNLFLYGLFVIFVFIIFKML